MGKKFILILAAVLVAIAAAACTYNDNPSDAGGNSDIRSFTFTLPSNGWRPAEERNHWYQRISAPEITPDIAEYGTVLCYFKNKYDAWAPLPSNELFPGDSLNSYKSISFSYLDNYIDFDYRDVSTVATYPYKDFLIKAVVLSEAFVKPWAVQNVPDYECLKKMYNLKD